jgi:tripartite-type tricarboxylate transporter receptor subunit TctC
VLPEVPTVAESGVPGYDAASWIGLLAPAATPRQAIDKLSEATSAAMRVAAVRDVLLRDGSDIVASTPAEFRQVIESDYAKYGKLRDLLKATQ